MKGSLGLVGWACLACMGGMFLGPPPFFFFEKTGESFLEDITRGRLVKMKGGGVRFF